MEDQREFVEHLQIGKQIGKLLDMPKRPQAQNTFLGLESEKSGNLVPDFEKFEKLDLPGHCYGSSKKWALWAPGALGPTPFRLCRRALRGFFFGKKGIPTTNNAYLLNNDVFL